MTYTYIIHTIQYFHLIQYLLKFLLELLYNRFQFIFELILTIWLTSSCNLIYIYVHVWYKINISWNCTWFLLRNAISKSQKLLYVEVYHLSWNFNIKICKYISLYIVCMYTYKRANIYFSANFSKGQEVITLTSQWNSGIQ